METFSVLIVDDDEDTCRILSRFLGSRRVTVARTKASALTAFASGRPPLVFLDVELPDGNGLDLVEVFLRIQPLTHVVVVTGEHDVELIVRAMRLGATHFLQKPFTLAQVQERVAIAERAHPGVDALHRTGFIGESPPVLEVLERIRRLATSNATTALLLGESGTGKEIAARALHAMSGRSSGPFVPVNCAALAGTLLESELFGYERGAFTGASSEGKPGLFELAAGGTILLDEIAETSPALQAALLRVVETRVARRVGGLVERPVDARIIASTNRDLAREVRRKRFRADLFYRLCVVPIVLPPLRARPGDVRLLAQHFLELAQVRTAGRRPVAFAPGALEALERHDWPGNVRELRNVVERGVILSGGEDVTAEHLSPGLEADLTGGWAPLEELGQSLPDTPPPTPRPASGPIRLDELDLARAERMLVLRALESARGNKRRAAALLGINRTTLYSKLRSLGLDKKAVEG